MGHNNHGSAESTTKSCDIVAIPLRGGGQLKYYMHIIQDW